VDSSGSQYGVYGKENPVFTQSWEIHLGLRSRGFFIRTLSSDISCKVKGKVTFHGAISTLRPPGPVALVVFH
jgi:hypothetical protein